LNVPKPGHYAKIVDEQIFKLGDENFIELPMILAKDMYLFLIIKLR
jgi:hypothetical protein